MVSNNEFANRVGCHFTMASRLRNGLRTPSAPMLAKIVRAFPQVERHMDPMWDALENDDSTAFGQWLTEQVFDRIDS